MDSLMTARPRISYDTTDVDLARLVEALAWQVQSTGIELLSVEREGATDLVVEIDETRAEEPLCPGAFVRVVRRLSRQLLNEVWEGRILHTSHGLKRAA